MDDAHDGPYAREPQIEDLVRICRVLNAAGGDLMGRACGIDYARAAQDATSLTFDDVASPATLILTKNTLRPSDAADRRYLEELLRAEGEGS